MVYVKFTPVKLIINYISLICLILFFSSEISYAKQKYAIQIAALKTEQDISVLAKKYAITDSIFIVRTELWYQYLIGSFDDFELATEYANELVQKTKLKNVFVKAINDETEHSVEIHENDSSNHSTNLVIQSLETDSVQQTSFVGNNKNEADSVGTKHRQKTKSESRNYVLNIFLENGKISALKNSLIDYCNNNLPQKIRGFFIALIEKSFQSPIIILFIAFICFFVLNLISVFLILNYTVKIKNQKERYKLIYGKMYEEVLISYLFGEIDWERASIKLKSKNRKKNREILISILLNFHENFKGEMEKSIPDIFVKLGLQKDSFKAVNSWLNYKKVQGIRELTNLYSKGAIGIISNLINDSDDNVRAEAQTAFIRLNPENPFKFFQKLTTPFTRWTQLSAFNLLRVNQLPVPSFAHFIDSKHPNIRNFSLRMIIYFQQLENITEIIKMLDSKMDLTRFLSYRAINDLRLYEAKEKIKNMFWTETDKNKLEIVKSFRNIGDLKDFEFLETIIYSESVSLKIEACRSMYFMNTEGKERLLKIKNESISELELFIEHVTDLRN